MNDLLKLLNKRKNLENFFSIEHQLSYEELFLKAQKLKLPTPTSDWLVIEDENNVENLMTIILACIFEGQNILLVKDIENITLEKKLIFDKQLIFDPKNLREVQFNNILFGIETSGSSGNSKIIVHPIRHLFTHAFSIQEALDYREGDVWYLSLPTYHMAGLSILFRALVTGGSVQKISKEQLSTLQMKGIISIVAAQADYLLQNNHLLENELKVFIGGGKIPPEILAKFIHKKFITFTSYAMSETASTFALKRHENTLDLLNLGTPIANGNMKIIDGKLALKTSTLFLGTLENETIIPPKIIDGYFQTNDLARIENGQLYIQGRSDQIFITGGKNVSLNKINKMIEEIFPGQSFYTLVHEHPKWGESYSIIFGKNNTYDQQVIKDRIFRHLKKEFSPDKIIFLPEDYSFKGIKPSKQELKDLLFPTSEYYHYIYLHGLLGNQNEFDDFIVEFNRHLKAINQQPKHLTLNLPTPDENESFISYVKKLNQLIQNKIQPNHKPICLIGFSMGARLAFYLKFYYPENYKKVISVSGQVISTEDKIEREKLDNSRLNLIKDQNEFEIWATNFFKFHIYGDFYKNEKCQLKIKNLQFKNINHYNQLFKCLSVVKQPSIKTKEIQWGENLLLISGKNDLKYTSLIQQFQKEIKYSQAISIPDGAHAIHLENPILLALNVFQYLFGKNLIK